MAEILVIGSGATGAHFALTSLRRGHRVTMVDVGYQRPQPVAPSASYGQLKEKLEDPVEYFLGEGVDRVVYPGPLAKHYAFPPSKQYVFQHPAPWSVVARGFEPMLSFARGGLAEAWTGGCYEFNDADLTDFPFTGAELRPHYSEIARRIGVTGARDDLERFSPFTAPYQTPLPLDSHSERLLSDYSAVRERLNARHGFFLGRSRVATLSQDKSPRGECIGLGRCLWGCPRESLWAPSMTVRECLTFDGFRYVDGHWVTHFQYDTDGRVTGIAALPLSGGSPVELRGDLIVMAAGAVGTSAIYLASIQRREGREETLGGLMDNQHAVIPFVNMRHLGAPLAAETYQFHLLALALEGEGGAQAAHGQITTLRTASVHPIVQNLPFDLRASLSAFRRLRSALGVANVWRAARRDSGNSISLRRDSGGSMSVALECRVPPAEHDRLNRAIDDVRMALRRLGCVAPRRRVQVLPLGSSVHYAGTIPMTQTEEAHTCAPDGRVRGFQNLIVADGASFPSLPAKNLTFTLMANANRIAELVPHA